MGDGYRTFSRTFQRGTQSICRLSPTLTSSPTQNEQSYIMTSCYGLTVVRISLWLGYRSICVQASTVSGFVREGVCSALLQNASLTFPSPFSGMWKHYYPSIPDVDFVLSCFWTVHQSVKLTWQPPVCQVSSEPIAVQKKVVMCFSYCKCVSGARTCSYL